MQEEAKILALGVPLLILVIIPCDHQVFYPQRACDASNCGGIGVLGVSIHNVLIRHTTCWRSPPCGMVVEHALVVVGHCELRSSQWCLKHIDNYILVSNSCAQLVIHQALQVQPGRLQPTAVACPDTQVQYRSIVRIQGNTGYFKEARVSVNFGRHLLQAGDMRQ